MAKPITKNISSKIDKIIKELKGVNQEIAKIAKEGIDEAQRTLASATFNENFTQKYGMQLIDEIGLVETSPNSYRIVAPISGDEEMALQMYYAEYGAGVGANNSLDKSPRAISGYKAQWTSKYGYWSYKTLQGKWHRVNTSEPANYMFRARNLMRLKMKQLKIRLQTRVRTTIQRISRQGNNNG